jgi:magnesium transporter
LKKPDFAPVFFISQLYSYRTLQNLLLNFVVKIVVMKKQKHSRKSGLPPGSPVYTGQKTGITVIDMIVFDDENFAIHKDISVDNAINYQGSASTNWIMVKGFSQGDDLQKLATHFGIHPLVIEDIFNVEHMPKVEDNENSLFVTLKNLSWNNTNQLIESEQISLCLGKNILISFEEKNSGIFDGIIERLRAGKGKGRLRQEDYLCYLLIDQVVDNYFLLLDIIEDNIEACENLLLNNPANELINLFLSLKKNLLLLRRSVNPLKEELREKVQEESELITAFTQRYFKDINDHLAFVIQSIDNYREVISSMMDLMMAYNANRMNNIMKTLTLVSTIVIPMTLVTGIYGMNFDNMPELHFKYGYPMSLGITAAMGVFMYMYMKKKKWF